MPLISHFLSAREIGRTLFGRRPASEHYRAKGYLSAYNLTPDELRKSRLPDRALKYVRALVRFDPDGCVISYSSTGKSKSHVFVHPLIEQGRSQMQDGRIFTQAELADFLELATTSPIPFTVESVFVFGELPKSTMRTSGLPLEKLTFSTDYSRVTELFPY